MGVLVLATLALLYTHLALAFRVRILPFWQVIAVPCMPLLMLQVYLP